MLFPPTHAGPLWDFVRKEDCYPFRGGAQSCPILQLKQQGLENSISFKILFLTQTVAALGTKK